MALGPHFAAAWHEQARQFPKTGRPGLERLTRHPRPDITVNALTYRNRKGHVIGILYHYPHDVKPGPGGQDQLIASLNGGVLEQAGNVNIWVRADRQHRGIGLRLVLQADRLWGPLNLDQQKYTPAGLALRGRLEETRTHAPHE